MNPFWTDREVKRLKKVYPAYRRGDVGRDDLVKLFRRTWEAIKRKACEQGLTGRETVEDTMDEEYWKKLKKVIKI